MKRIAVIKGSCKTFNSIQKGVIGFGDEFIVSESISSLPNNVDCFMQTNLLKPKFYQSDKHKIYEYILKTKKPFLVQESASFRDYIEYSRLGWYSYKWTEGLFGNENCPRDRWTKFENSTGIKFKDWHSPGSAIIIMGQKEGDSSLIKLYEKYKTFYDWVEEIIIEVRKYSNRPIIIRPHPRNLGHGVKFATAISKKFKDITVNTTVKSNGIAGGDNLIQDLKNAYCVITYNSLSAVEAITYGIPTFALDDGSMIWPIAHKDLSTIEKLNYNIDITQWQNDIAYCQWTGKEHASGESWAHLKPLVFKD